MGPQGHQLPPGYGFLSVGSGGLSRKRTWPPLVSCGTHDRERGESVKTWESSMAESEGGNSLMYSLRCDGTHDGHGHTIDIQLMVPPNVRG